MVQYLRNKGRLATTILLQINLIKKLPFLYGKLRNNPTDNSQVWSVKADKKGNIWFTDEKQNAIWKYSKSLGSFEVYKVPESPKAFGTAYPVSIDFDSKGNLYFVGIRSPVLWFGNITQMKSGTTNGITKIPLPTTGFKGIDPSLLVLVL